MKKVIFIGNRFCALKELLARKNRYSIESAFVLKASPLEKQINDSAILETYTVFSLSEKKKVIEQIRSTDFDILVSNGNPFLLPVSEMKKDFQLFINVHPTYLPDLRGKTPLNGIIYLNYSYLGATTHYMDDSIDTGRIIYQERIRRTPDLDLGLIYFLSFQMESRVFAKALDKLESTNFRFPGKKQKSAGSSFSRESSLFKIDFQKDNTETLLRKINSVGMFSQAVHEVIEGQEFCIYHAEPIVNPFLLSIANRNLKGAGSIVHRYDETLILKTKDGMVKCRVKVVPSDNVAPTLSLLNKVENG